jgi:hypothetical protein
MDAAMDIAVLDCILALSEVNERVNFEEDDSVSRAESID